MSQRMTYKSIIFHKTLSFLFRRYRTEIVPEMRSRFFRQIVQKRRRHTGVCQGAFVQDDGKSASRSGTKPLGVLCAVLPLCNLLRNVAKFRFCMENYYTINALKKRSKQVFYQFITKSSEPSNFSRFFISRSTYAVLHLNLAWPSTTIRDFFP